MTEEESQAVKNDEQYVVTWLKEAIQKREMSAADEVDVASMQMLEKLVTADKTPDEFSESYAALLKSPEQSVLLSNLSEYLLEQLAAQKIDEA